ncbi:MAG: hypothetical protein OXI53_03215 [Nitrospira sp.]|nr:hypothetical protein [Nitrospira sp.]MDE0404301.1 hypothetical protein [Nitrospira sp.]MDE0487430.1 hypothetical protein [Nitrospira sp.]
MPTAGFIGPILSIWIGFGAGVVCYLAVVWKAKFGYHDALDWI